VGGLFTAGKVSERLRACLLVGAILGANNGARADPLNDREAHVTFHQPRSRQWATVIGAWPPTDQMVRHEDVVSTTDVHGVTVP